MLRWRRLTNTKERWDGTTVSGNHPPWRRAARQAPLRPARAGVHDHRNRCSWSNGL